MTTMVTTNKLLIGVLRLQLKKEEKRRQKRTKPKMIELKRNGASVRQF